MRRWQLADVAATQALAAALAQARPAAGTQPQPLLLALHGELGAGKTTFVQGLLAALGVAGPVRSPTYTLVESYPLRDGGSAVHADLYRLASPLDFEELGLRDEFRPGALWLVEWPEKAAGVLPPADLELRLAFCGTGRHAELAAGSDAGSKWLQAVAALPSESSAAD